MSEITPRYSISVLVGVALAALAAGSMMAISFLAGAADDLITGPVRPVAMALDIPPVVVETPGAPQNPGKVRPRPGPSPLGSDLVAVGTVANEDPVPRPDTSGPDRRRPTKPTKGDGKDKGGRDRDRDGGKDKGKDKDHNGPDHARGNDDKGSGHGKGPKDRDTAPAPAPRPQGEAKGHRKSQGGGHDHHPHSKGKKN